MIFFVYFLFVDTSLLVVPCVKEYLPHRPYRDYETYIIENKRATTVYFSKKRRSIGYK